MANKGVLVLVCLGLVLSLCYAFDEPQLLWKYGGPCFNSWCHQGWYSSPAVTEINGEKAVIGGFYAFAAVYGKNGTNIWMVDGLNNGNARIWPDIAIADVDNDGNDEVITGHGSGYLGVWNVEDGTPLNASVWPLQVTAQELRALAVADLDLNGDYELVVGRASGTNTNTWVIEHDGSVRSGWPRRQSEADGYNWGVYNNNIGICNMDSDDELEIIAPSDVHYVCAYEANGTPITSSNVYNSKVWGQVPFCTVESSEIIGAGCPCDNPNDTEPTRTNFADGPVSIADLDNDGTEELVFTGRTYYFCDGDEDTTYNGVYIMNKDRTRYHNPSKGYSWKTVPTKHTAKLLDPISTDYNVIQANQPNSVLADLDGDGELEILFPSYDGQLHAFWLDRTEHCNWPYDLLGGINHMRFATPPAVVDLDNDGYAEVIFATWPEAGSNNYGELLILNATGNLVFSVDLPIPKACTIDCGDVDWAGSLASPTVANIDDTPDVEVVLVTTHAGIVAYTIPDSANAKILWGTGRGGYERTSRVTPPTTTGTPSPACPSPDADQTSGRDSGDGDGDGDGDGAGSRPSNLFTQLLL